MANPILLLLSAVVACGALRAQSADTALLLRPDRVFDGEEMHSNWVVLIRKNTIVAAGDAATIRPEGPFKTMDLKGKTLLPGWIEGHSHLFLHPYDETKWDEQVMNESRAERTSRAVVHAKRTLLAGFTTVRDLGTEGADYDDVGLKAAIDKGIIPGPRMIIATRAIVATGSYGPKTKNTEHALVKGAAEADGTDALTRETRTQIGHGADLIKVYADYRWGLNKDIAEPTFTLEELKTVVAVASSAGRKVVAHASTEEGMRRSILAGISTIEHGDNATAEIFDLMLQHKVAYCPTLSAAEAVSQYNGWKKGSSPEPQRIITKRKSFALALRKGVTICFGGDVGVFAHGDNAREMEAMVAYGMPPIDVLKSATSVNADVFGYHRIGRIRAGLLADLVAVTGNPAENISRVRNPALVIKDGIIYVNTP